MSEKINPLKNKSLYIIFGITFIAVMGVASITPALPKVAHLLHLTKGQVALLISFFTFPGIFLSPISGILADRYGRKAVIIPSLFLFAISGFALFFVHGFHLMLVLRALQGIGAAPLGSLNTTLIGDYFTGKERPAAMGFNASVLSISTASFPVVGGFLAGITWYYPFVLPLLAIPVGLFVLFGLEEPKIEKTTNLKQYLKDISGNLAHKEVIAIFILGTLTFVILYGAFMTYIPFLLDHKFGLTSAKIGIVFALSSVTMAVVASQIGKLTLKFGSLALFKTAFVIYMLVNLIIPNINSLYFIIIPVMMFGTAQALNIPSLHTSVANIAPDAQRGAFMSLNGMVIRLGQTLGPLVIGIGYSINGMIGAYYLGAGVAAIGILVLFTMIDGEKIKGH